MTAAVEQATPLRVTPLVEEHIAAGARMVPFAGWSMPIQYAGGVLAEHRAVRRGAGLFDVSHMGQAFVTGSGAANSLQRLLSNDITRLDVDGRAQYTLLTNERGGIEDDLIAYRLGDDEYLLVLNASNRHTDIDLLRAGLGVDTELVDASDEWAMLALQGPTALDVLRDRCGIDMRSLPPFSIIDTTWNDVRVLAAKCGGSESLRGRFCRVAQCFVHVEAAHAVRND